MTNLTTDQIQALRAVIQMLRSPRNRFGCIEPTRETIYFLAQFDCTFGNIPHGGSDSPDKAQMILSLMIGDPVMSIVD